MHAETSSTREVSLSRSTGVKEIHRGRNLPMVIKLQQPARTVHDSTPRCKLLQSQGCLSQLPPVYHDTNSLPPFSTADRLTRSTLELLSEEEELHLIVDGQDTGTCNTTENVGTSTLEERLDTLLGDNLAGGIERRVVLDGLT